MKAPPVLAVFVALILLFSTSATIVSNFDDEHSENDDFANHQNITLAADNAELPTLPTRTTSLDLTDPLQINSDEGKGQGWSWNDEAKILTLSGAVIIGNNAGENCFGIKLPTASIIHLAEGTQNYVIAADSNTHNSYGIFAEGDLTINGSGSLTAIGGTAGKMSCGIYADEST